MGKHGWEYRRRQPEGTVLDEAVRDNLATLLTDVFTSVRSGGRRRVLEYLKEGGGVRAIVEHQGLPTAPGRLAPARGPQKAAWC